MEEKTIRMFIYYVLAVCDNDKKTIESCIEENKLIIAIIKNQEQKKLDELIDLFPENHPVKQIYYEIKNRDDLLYLLENSKLKFEQAKVENNSLMEIKNDEEALALSKKISNN